MDTLYLFGGHTYQLSTIPRNWTAADAFAKSVGGHLATVSNKIENTFLLQIAKMTIDLSSAPSAPDGGGGRYLWLGANDIANEGIWKWTDGSKFTGYSNWGSGWNVREPDNFGNQDALGFALSGWPYNRVKPDNGVIGNTGEWNDLAVGNKLYSMIEWDRTKTGSKASEKLIGSSAAERMDGGFGNDFMTGGAGQDRFIFSTKLDWKNNVDTITDFSTVDDTIELENAVFTQLRQTGVLRSDFFCSAADGQAKDSSDRLVYSANTGNLFYDPDGSGKAAALLFAHLKAGLKLSAADFFVV